MRTQHLLTGAINFIVMGSSGSSKMYERKSINLAERQHEDNLAYKREQQARADAQKEQFRAFQFTNPFEGMENPYEDMTVSQEASRFQMEQGAQQRANIMQGLSGAAGASGIAGLAQSLAQQGTMQARQVSADISRQEAANQQAMAQGSFQTDMMRRQGSAAVQGAEFGRESTMYAAELGELAGARAAEQGAIANQQAALGMSASNAAQRSASNTQMALTTVKLFFMCVPKGTLIDAVDDAVAIEDVKPGDVVIGYNGEPVKVLQKHEYLENPDAKRFYKVNFKDGRSVDVCDMHKIGGVRAKDITEDVVSKDVYGGVELSYDLLTEDLGYRINGVPVNSMIEEMACYTAELLKDK